ncbi:aromatic ring-hydroxylating dioxygenase subunit alpha [Frankia sp. CNm7]|uniref:Aromatic ring-hydroxylating dioxygenase subunit alpha n=1 Tax=Frankia nepalensis TaxID=1836974 RepID=A0A937UPP2_9ACTN|nr:aromatic ring-hydroxylating dioxygenase subunit alpha [Frankia nepalensis]MBL7498445.1 aromatic ring-hydroxylating dioxygenase subunit alpha [Frankia nepalensis]MBL7509468.1 aromatic ring-hydroxylating dioxygenase subunit alpha [Frankia nepalensis]MBL7522099.1 aromatic ring-hydroxylating dioxygenase subunit alpha [Frankia nepalensis]MBL7629278.1 aromatic ring-hydroxylating dioxygenase subunit alpha [Frankia nepalensis]
MPRFPKPPEGSWTEHYPGLGTGPVSYEDSISPEYFEREKEAIFKRAWLNVGRVEQLPRMGSYFTKDIKAAHASIVVVRDKAGQVRAFHNMCRHRGNKLVWTDDPKKESQGVCRQFACKYHGWRYDLDGSLTFIQQEGEFFDVDKSQWGLAPVHCDVWAGFIFVNFAHEPKQPLREFLGPMVTDLEGYPFERMTARFGYSTTVGANWKLFMDAFAEFYHAPVLHGNQSPEKYSKAALQAGFEAPHYQIEEPHRLVSTSGVRFWEMGADMIKPMEALTRGGLFGPWDKADLGEMPKGVNPAKCDPWGLDSFQLFPNFVILIWSQGWYLTYHYWPTSHNTHVFEGNVYFLPATNIRDRIAQEMSAVTFKEFALQDANTLEATQMMLETRYVDRFLLNDQEILCRHLHKVVGDWVNDYEGARR